MKPGYQNPDARKRFFKDYASAIVVKLAIGYCLLSAITIPFMEATWIGELSLPAVVQLPKIFLADRLRKGLVMPVIRALGLSSGSFSPDYTLARPWALALAYLIPLTLLFIAFRQQTRWRKPYLRLALILLASAVLDYFFTLHFASQPGITIY